MSADYSDEQSNLLQRYLDSELSESEQSRFFSAVSQSDSLRRDFNVMLRVRDQLSRDLVPPPVHIESAVLAALKPAATVFSRSTLARTALVGACVGSLLTFFFLWNSWKVPLDSAQMKLAMSMPNSAPSESNMSSPRVQTEAASSEQYGTDNKNSINSLSHSQISKGKRPSSITTQLQSMQNRDESTLHFLKKGVRDDAGGRGVQDVNQEPNSNGRSSMSLANAHNRKLQSPSALAMLTDRSYSRTASGSLWDAQSKHRVGEEGVDKEQAPDATHTSTPSKITTPGGFGDNSKSSDGSGILNNEKVTRAQSQWGTITARQSSDNNDWLRSVDVLPTGAGDESQSSLQSGLTLNRKANMNIEFRSFYMRSYPNVSVSGLVDPPINNFALSFSRSISDEHVVGFEFGQENVFQQYETTLNNRAVQVDQNYLAWWAGVLYQYSPQALRVWDLQPFTRLTLGGTRIGPVGRVMLGVRYYFTDNFGCMLSTEAMQVLSQQNSSAVSSSKLGLSGGFLIRF